MQLYDTLPRAMQLQELQLIQSLGIIICGPLLVYLFRTWHTIFQLYR